MRDIQEVDSSEENLLHEQSSAHLLRKMYGPRDLEVVVQMDLDRPRFVPHVPYFVRNSGNLFEPPRLMDSRCYEVTQFSLKMIFKCHQVMRFR